MNFDVLEVGKLYVANNDEYAEGCVIECIGVFKDYANFKVIKGNEHYNDDAILNYGEKFISDERFKPLIKTQDDVHECEGMTTQEKVDALEEYCEQFDCNNCMFVNKCNYWYDIDNDGKQILREEGINADYERLVASKCKQEVVEKVNHPSHYNQGIEAIEYIESHNMDFNEGNVIKYVTRAKYKGTYIEDLKKARWYLDRLIQKGEKDEN